MNKPQISDVIGSRKTRSLAVVRFEENQNMSIKLPLDTTLVGLLIRLTGAVQTTYASGTPVAKAESIMDCLIKKIEVQTDGRDTHKSVRPHFLHLQNLLANGVQPERCSSAGAAAVANPTVDGGFVFGTTGQYTSVRESVYLPFEMVYSEPGLGRESTYLNLKNKQSAELKIDTNAFANLLGFGNTAPVVWGNNTLQIEVATVERQDIPANAVFHMWKQTMRSQPFSGETRDYPVDLANSNYLTDILMYCQDGAAGSATTATGKVPSNLLVDVLDFKRNGSDGQQRWDFRLLQNTNRNEYGIVAPYVANASRMDGVAHLNFISRRDLDTALPCMKPITDNVQLFLSTKAAGTVDYTNPANVHMLVGELIRAKTA